MIVFNNIPADLPQAQQLIPWLEELCVHYAYSCRQLSYSFVSEEALLSLNKDFLMHDTHTDIITFSYGSNPIEAEIYISIPRMIENAQKFKQSTENELLRLISHGLLHCAGFNDKNKKEQALMRKEEDRCIKLFHVKQKKNV